MWTISLLKANLLKKSLMENFIFCAVLLCKNYWAKLSNTDRFFFARFQYVTLGNKKVMEAL